MTKREGKAGFIDVKGLLQRDEDFLRSAVEGLVHAGWTCRTNFDANEN
jgi:hypothetical protein